jgi:hypothetical protein
MMTAHIRPWRSSIGVSITIAVVVAALIACASAIRSTVDHRISDRELAGLWEPGDPASRDLFYGVGGRRFVPDPNARYELLTEDRVGFSLGYDVKDGKGTEWDVKLGLESRTEVVASRIIWAVGYHQPPMHHVGRWRLSRKDATSVEGPARFRPNLESLDKKGPWSWHRNPFVGTRPYRALIVLNVLLGNSDLKPPNNEIYNVGEPFGPPSRWFVVKDVGHTFGRTGKLHGTRDDPAGFREHGFIREVRNGKVVFEWNGFHGELVEDIEPADVRWICERLGRITPAQWQDAFRAGGYTRAEAAPFIQELHRRIEQGRRLAGS